MMSLCVSIYIQAHIVPYVFSIGNTYEKREDREGTLSMFTNILRANVKRMGPGSFQWCPVTGQGAMGTNKKFHLKMRKNFFTLRVPEPRHRLPREAVQSPSLQTFKTHLDIILHHLL